MRNVSRVGLVTLHSVISAAGLSAQSMPPVLSEDQIREKIKQRIPYQFEDDVHFTVAMGEAVALQCPVNPYGLDDFVIYPDGEGLIWYSYCGEVTAKHYREKERDKKGSVEQIGYAPYVAIIQWTIQGHQLKTDFCITQNKDKIGQAVDRVLRERGEWSSRIKSTNLLPAVKIPEAERIAGFVRLWSEVKYNFAFFDKVPELDWEKVLDDYLPRVQKATTAPNYYKVLRECMALLHDGHTEVWGPSSEASAPLPVLLAPVDGKAVIVAVVAPDKIRKAAHRDEMAKAALKLGEEVTHIDGQPVSKILRQKFYPYICASTPQGMDLKAYPRLLTGEPGSKARLTVRSLDGKEREVTLTRGYARAVRPNIGRPDGDVGDGIFYVSLDSFGDDAVVKRFESHLPEIRKARGLILDVRENGGGSTGNGAAIISHLTDKTLKGSHWKTRMYRPAFRAWGQPEAWHEGDHTPAKPAKDPYLGPVVVLTGPQTFSAAEDFLVVLKAAGRAKLVGERSGGSTGQPLMIKNLPAGGGARICTKRDTFPDGTDFVGVGVIPDVEVHPTAADIAAGRDSVFEEGLATLKKMISR